VPSDEDDWKLSVRYSQLALKIETALVRQSHVEDEAGWAVRQIGFEKV
jgi:hypothetical protein